ncbi:tRNA-guanine transglycosylase DpdA [Neobacillus pocheonensis]|uniref:tRNA-guanine transglycosylase DpdA n=1 Tax=Neobacillus pocheonensis TaxID=363869 RepID=UPI003D2B17D9
MKLLIITSCTNSKIYSPEQQLNKSDFSDSNSLLEKENQLAPFKAMAKDMYTGRQHLWIMEGINNLREKYGDSIVDLAIVSAGYGLVSEDQEIVPYNVTFANMKKDELTDWSNKLKINEHTSEKIKSYDMVFFLLGEEYLNSLQLPFEETRQDQKLVFLGSKASVKLIPNNNPYHYVEVGNKDANDFGKMSISLKGYLFKILAKEIVENGLTVLDKIYDDPQSFLQTLEKYRKDDSQQLSLFPDERKEKRKGKVMKTKIKQTSKIVIAESMYAKNYGIHKLNYFMPENDDRVDPNFNWITEEHTKDRNPLDDYYSHEIYDKPNYDGVLISKINIDQSENRKDLILNAGGLHKFLRLPNDIPLYGDCGAFSYIEEEIPPYTTDEILDYYDQMGFNIGTSIDHLIIGKIAENEEMRNFRYKLTLKNAADFLIKHSKGNYKFTPTGVAQGWDVESYKNAFVELIKMGYKHISLGGLALAKSEEILEILKAIAPIVPEYLEIHLFGAARLEYIDIFHKLGVTSFDSTTFLKKAWGSATGGNYFTDIEKYAAIRIPQSDIHPKVKELVNRGINTAEAFLDLEQKSLKSVREFDQGNIDITNTVETVLEYDSYIETLKDYNDKYKKEKTLKNKFISEKLELKESEVLKIEKDIVTVFNKLIKKKELMNMNEFLLRDLSFNMFMSNNENILKNSGRDLLLAVKEIAESNLKKAYTDKNVKKQILDIKEKILQLEEKEIEKKVKISKYLIGSLSFKSLIIDFNNLDVDIISNVVFKQLQKFQVAESEAIQEKKLALYESTLKDYFAANYDRIFSANKLRSLYQKVLNDKPWKHCSCSICKEVGVEVIIFRGNNRNRRRGFHNTHVFYNQLKEIQSEKERSLS